MKFEVDENMIMWAFRYALGRKTGAVDSVITHLKNNWPKLEDFTKRQICQEIEIAIRRDDAGDECDVERWEEIFEL